MKLFIKNHKYFIDTFPENSRNKSHKEIHKQAYFDLSKALSEGNIPVMLLPLYKEDGNAIFNFRQLLQDEIYVYEFTGIVS